MSLAWHIAAMHPRRVKRLPKLDELTGSTKPRPQQQSWQEMRNYARMLTVALGGTVTERKAEE